MACIPLKKCYFTTLIRGLARVWKTSNGELVIIGKNTKKNSRTFQNSAYSPTVYINLSDSLTEGIPYDLFF